MLEFIKSNMWARLSAFAIPGILFGLLVITPAVSTLQEYTDRQKVLATDYYVINTYAVVPAKVEDCNSAKVLINRTALGVDVRFNIRIERQGETKEFLPNKNIEIPFGFYSGTSTRSLSRPAGWFCLESGTYREVINGYYQVHGIDKTLYYESETFTID